jgi:AraC-like DNA-binding protein
MANTDLGAVAFARASFPWKQHLDRSASIVEDEPAWRSLPARAQRESDTRIVASRWRSFDAGSCEVSAENPADRHLVAIVLRREDIRLSLSGRVVHDGVVLPGMLQVTEPGALARCVFRGPYDVLHLHVPNGVIAELARNVAGDGNIPLRTEGALSHDPVVERLGRALLSAEDIGDPFAQLYADCVSTAVVSRLIASSRGSAPRPGKVAELARWRLKRVVDYVDASLPDPVSLADLAAAAGLTRMHFAAQFRAATGLPPHEYLLRRRIERAQEMLVHDDAALVEIALSVGFQTQSHFTTVFKRFTGHPPRAWRLWHRDKENEDGRSPPDGRMTIPLGVQSPNPDETRNPAAGLVPRAASGCTDPVPGARRGYCHAPRMLPATASGSTTQQLLHAAQYSTHRYD